MWPGISLRGVGIAVAVGILAVLPARMAPAAETVVTDVRVGNHGATTRFVLDLTDHVDFRIFSLPDPYRVVIDLPEVGWRLPQKPLPANTGLLATLRYGLFKPGTSRVVLDVKGPAAVKDAFALRPNASHGHRLVVDLVRTTREAFLQNARGGPKTAKQSTKRAATTARVAPPPPPAKPLRRPVKRLVVLDAGHGGVDPGAIGVSGIYEKHITLAVAREVKTRLERTGRYKVLLTRDRDVFIRLRDRVAFARDAGAELFVSIHADAIRNRHVRGLAVYTLSEKASDKEAAALAEKENKADLIAGIDLSGETAEVTNILIDLAQRETMNESAQFAAVMVDELARETRLLRNTHRFAGFAVLKAPDVPSILVELGFLSNRQDERALRRKDYRGRLAAAIARAIDRYFVSVEEARRQ